MRLAVPALSAMGLGALLAIGLGAIAPARADVARVEILERSDFAGGIGFGQVGAYERLRGRLHYRVDPAAAHNRQIVDIDKAPVDADGLVAFSGDFLLLRPKDPSRGNGALLYDVNNRGRLLALGYFNAAPRSNDPRTVEDAGTGFLMRHGFTVMWSGWNWDMTDDNDGPQLDVPIAMEDGAPAVGRIAYEFAVTEPARTAFIAGMAAHGFPLAHADPTATLTVRDRPGDARVELPRKDWVLARIAEDGTLVPSDRFITAERPFKPGRIYELVIDAFESRVVGLGLAAIRDGLDHFRNDPALNIDRVVIFGHSQSARLIAHMLWQGLHLNAAGRPVFDGAYVRVAGAGKGSFNHRFAQTSRHFSQFEDLIYPTDFFPFSTATTTDPVTGQTASLFDRAREAGAGVGGTVPKVFFTNSSAEYWARAASLLHTDTLGRRDVAPDPNARIYALLGAQHFHARWPTPRQFEYCVNPLDKRPTTRALLLALDAWVKDGTEPPASAYPSIARGELGTLDRYLASLPVGIPPTRPESFLTPPRLDHGARFRTAGIEDQVPPLVTGVYETRVPLPDGDGNDRGGIGFPLIQAPLGTHLGWNPRNQATGGAKAISRWLGSFVPFAATRADRLARGDLRPSLAERYGDRAGYALAITTAVEDFASRGFILADEKAAMVADALGLYDRIVARDPDDAGCAYLSD